MQMRIITIILTTLIFSACQSKNMKKEISSTYAFRLKPGEDLIEAIEKITTEKAITAGWIATCVGSLTDYTIRFANQPEGSTGSGHFEIVSLAGTVSVNGSHLHISISDSTGQTIGGHLMPGCKIYTTAEIVIQSTDKFEFTREKDGSTPWEELQVKEKKK
ncbi:MAG: PPC domain-containing DNA-binding protein [Bacteroidota bacterium]